MSATLRMVYHVPVFGWALKDAINGAPDAKYYFAANLVFAFILLLYLFGYAFLICFALAATALALTTLIMLVAADMFDGKRRPVQASVPKRR